VAVAAARHLRRGLPRHPLCGGRLARGGFGGALEIADSRRRERHIAEGGAKIFAVDEVSALRATATRVYVVHMSTLEIYDAASGKKVAIIGDETYEH
jgi:hypothetical protein